MPELPEVDLVARTLDTLVTGKHIESAKLLRQRLIPDMTPSAFGRSLKDAVINGVTRRGKHILIELDNGKTLIVHLRMSGRFSLLGSDDEDRKFTHAVFYFDDGTRLAFDDQRHFGAMKIISTADLAEAKELKKLAPEPFSDEFTTEYLRDKLKRSKRTLKEFLLDQTKVTGLGNIYAAEALFASGISPKIRTDRLSISKINILHKAIVEVLAAQVEISMTSSIDPRNIDGHYYSSDRDKQWIIYGREGEQCKRCDAQIKRIQQAGRSTYYCPKCQK